MSGITCISCVALLGLCCAPVHAKLIISTEGPFAGYYVQDSRVNSFHPNYIGCVTPGPLDGEESFPHEAHFREVSIMACITYCREATYTFAGLKGENECFCGDQHFTAQEIDCRLHCTNSRSDVCGGDYHGLRMSAYRVCDIMKHGPDCSSDCPACISGCFLNGTCLPGCSVGQTKYTHSDGGVSCTDGCPPAKFGFECSGTNDFCADDLVHPLNGYCVKGCKFEWSKGIFCFQKLYAGFTPDENPIGACPLCEHCESSSCYGDHRGYNYYYTCPVDWSGQNCTACQDGYWGAFCNRACPDWMCTQCDQYSGQCERCRHGYYGLACVACPKNCLGGGCNISSGCTDGCAPGFFSSHCNLTCSTSCVGSCSQEVGICHTCPNGSYGNLCSFNCPRTCKDSMCGQLTGDCTLGCKKDLTGIRCRNVIGDDGFGDGVVGDDDAGKPMSDTAMVAAIVGGLLAVVIIIVLVVTAKKNKKAAKAHPYAYKGRSMRPISNKPGLAQIQD